MLTLDIEARMEHFCPGFSTIVRHRVKIRGRDRRFLSTTVFFLSGIVAGEKIVPGYVPSAVYRALRFNPESPAARELHANASRTRDAID